MRCPLLVLVLISAALGAGGCEGTYTAYPGYGPYYGGYGPGYRPGYAAYPGSVTVEVGDRGYYYSWSWLLRRPHLLRLEARALEMAEWSKSLDPRPLRRARILIESGCYYCAGVIRQIALNDRLRQAPARKAETQSRSQAAQSVTYASAEVDR